MRTLLTAMLFLAVGTATAGPVSEVTLDNGLKVVVKQDRRSPIMVSQIWYKVGSSYEPFGITGVSHVLEHMMFKGTEKLKPGEFSRIISANGGDDNAFTSKDYTAYFQMMSADRLEVSIKLEADRMRSLTFSEQEFAKEIEVVKEERRLRTEDKPTSQTYEQFVALAYRSLPYAHPVIGWMNDLNNLTLDDVKQWYERWYAPNNATLVVVGDVEPEQVFKLAKRYFGPLKAATLSEHKSLVEAPQWGAIRSVVHLPAREPYLIMGYKTPNIGSAEHDWEPYALDMLVAVLDGGGSSRFSRSLVRGEEVAVSASASYDAFTRLPGMLMLSGSPARGKNIEALERSLRLQIERVKTELVAEDELNRVKAGLIAEQVYELDSVFYQAMQIGVLETVGLRWSLLDEYVEKMKRVTPEQIRAVANKFLVEDKLTVTELDPLPMESGLQRATSQAGVQYGS